MNGDGDGDGVGTGTEIGVKTRERTWDGNGDGSGDGNGAVAEMVMGMRMGTGTGMRTRSGRAEETRRSAKTNSSVLEAIRHLYFAYAMISVYRRWRLRANDSPVHIARCLCTRIAPRGQPNPRHGKERTESGA